MLCRLSCKIPSVPQMQLKDTITHRLYYKLHFFKLTTDLRDTIYVLLALHHDSFVIACINKWKCKIIFALLCTKHLLKFSIYFLARSMCMKYKSYCCQLSIAAS